MTTSTVPTTEITPEFVAELAAGLRRRRLAAAQLPPLPDGRRDPLFELPPAEVWAGAPR